VGAKSTRLGHTRLSADTPPEEVRYYYPDQMPSVFADELRERVPAAYGGWNIEAMDAHGGWISSAIDLVRFGGAYDDPKKCKVLSEASVTKMFAPPGEDALSGGGNGRGSYYGCGWWCDPRGNEGKCDANHSGSLSGTATMLMRRADGRTFAILFNARSSPDADHFGSAIQGRLSRAIDQVEEWPEVDYY